jgi:mycofactocin precursor
MVAALRQQARVNVRPMTSEVVPPDPAPAEPADGDELIEDELIIEEISIDGMCGVY